MFLNPDKYSYYDKPIGPLTKEKTIQKFKEGISYDPKIFGQKAEIANRKINSENANKSKLRKAFDSIKGKYVYTKDSFSRGLRSGLKGTSNDTFNKWNDRSTKADELGYRIGSGLNSIRNRFRNRFRKNMI